MKDREQVTLRLPPQLAENLRAKADAKGVSTNSLIMILLDMGLQLYESEIIRQVEPPRQ
jgi:predicted HicB family RNase H-like nuclease